MIRLIQLYFFVLSCMIMVGCRDDLDKDSKYNRPDWLAGKLYTQVKDQPELSTFAYCLELTGYDTIINRSGSYTVFAPNDEAFSLYFDNHPDYNSVEDIPADVLLRLVKFHIVQNPWSKDQLTSLDVYGWIDTLDIENDEPRGFKRITVLLEEDLKLGVKFKGKDEAGEEKVQIVDTLESNLYRIVAADSRKYVPFFYDEYFNIYDLSPSDYEYYFDRTIAGPNDIYFASGRIIGEEIFAENGFVYRIDRVVEPMPSAYQLLSKKGAGNESYNEFLKLIELFPEFTYNEQKTFDQAGAELGYAVDSLFDLTFPELVFDVTSERTSPPQGTYGLPGNVTIRYHHGIVVPTNDAFNEFVDKYLSGGGSWGAIENTPEHIRRIIANTHMSINPIYPSDMEKGFYNGERDLIRLNQEDVVFKQFGSNCTFIGLDQTLVPRAFTSVAYPAYLKRKYSKVMYAIEETGLMSALNREDENYQFYIESDINSSLDSSLMYNKLSKSFSVIQRFGGSFKQYNLNTTDLRT